MIKSKEIKEFYLGFSKHVLRERSIPDSHDLLRYSQRMILFALYQSKFTSDQPFHKSLRAIGEATKLYTKGDSSLYSVLTHQVRPYFSYVPLCEGKGNFGARTNAQSESAARYTEIRLSKAADFLFKNISKNIIPEFYSESSYDGATTFYNVLPSFAPIGLINGVTGAIGVGMTSSIPPLNPSELIDNLIKGLNNEKMEILLPDFPTGATIINPMSTKASLEKGSGAAVKIRGELVYSSKDNSISIISLPYQVYTDTICAQLQELLDTDENCIFDDFIDLTKIEPEIIIKLKKDTDVSLAMEYIYKNTSAEDWFSINLNALDDERKPKKYSQIELFETYLKWQEQCYRKSFEWDLQKAKDRLEIVEGLLRAASIIEEIIKLIKNSKDRNEAKARLIKIDFTERQAEAILKIALGQLTNLDITKLEKERKDLEKEIERITEILSDIFKLRSEIASELLKFKSIYGCKRRTQIATEKEINKINKSKEEIKLDTIIYFDRNGTFDFAPTNNIVGKDIFNTKKWMVVVTKDGYALRCKGSNLKKAGKTINGIVMGASLLDLDESFIIFTSDNHYKVFKCEEIPETSRNTKGKKISDKEIYYGAKFQKNFEFILDSKRKSTKSFSENFGKFYKIPGAPGRVVLT